MLFGIDKAIMEQKPMTREEAVETCAKYAMQYPRVFVDCLAALGLLKFEEVPKKQIIELGRFTRITMANGSYVQGYIESLEQP